MRNKYLILFFLVLSSAAVSSQQPVPILKVVDSLNAAERKLSTRVLLKSELDSLINQYELSKAVQPLQEPEKILVQADNTWPLALALLTIGILAVGILVFYRQQQRLIEKLTSLKENSGNEPPANASKKPKLSGQQFENKIEDLKSALNKLSKENEGLSRVIKEYNGIQHDYDSIKQGILKAYKVRNYPGYDQSKQENHAIQSVLNTEQSVSAYAYDKYLKPLFAIVDANKNAPARTPDAEKQKIVNLLVSLSLLYIEYLYLRVNELSIGGKMVDRIQGFEQGNGIDSALLKKLDMEFGSRALVVKLALKNAGLNELAYPVFDETNLNNQ